jgi:hypothetical protein
MSRGSRVASVLVLTLFAARPPLHAQATADQNTVGLFTVEYADGRTVKDPVREKNWNSWTSQFPRVPGADTTNDGLALTALEVDCVVEPRDLIVTVALRYGMPHQKRVPVATVKLTEERPVRVDELTEFGVKPITLAIISVTRPQLPIPTVTTPSSHLEVSADVDTRGAPIYRISITNHAKQAVMALAFEAYRGQIKSASGKPHTKAHTPLITPEETYTVTLNASANGRSSNGADMWLAIDRIVFTSVTWSDGIVEGSSRPALETQVVDDATARQLARALALMRDTEGSEAPGLPQLRAAIASLSINDPPATSLSRIGMQIAKDALLNDLDEVLRDPRSTDPAARRAWLTSAVAKFDAWRDRIVTAPR